MKWVKYALLKFRDVSCFFFYSLHLGSWTAPVHGQCSQVCLQPSNCGHFCLVCKYQVQQRTLPHCLPDHLYQEIVMNTLKKSLWAIQLSSQKNTGVNVPQEPGSVNEILLPFVWRQSKLYFQSQTPTPTPPTSSPPNSWLSPGWSQSITPCIQLLSHQGQLSLSLPSQAVLLEMLSLLIIALHHVNHPTTPPQSWWGHSHVTAQGLVTPPLALKQMCCIREALHTSPQSCKRLGCTTSIGPIGHQ